MMATMEQTVGTREEWTAALKRLRERESELAALGREVAEQRRALPWVRVEKEYRFDTDAGQRTLAELFDGRSQLLIYNLMFGPGYTKGACPGCTGLADHFDAAVVHLNHRDVTLLAISRAPLPMLQAYKRRMGWSFPWVSSYGSDYGYDFGFTLTDEQASTGEMAKMIADPPDFLKIWAEQVGADLAEGVLEGPGWIVFAQEDGVVYHTYSRHAPDGALLAPYYYQLLDQTPQGRGEQFKAVRHDEYTDIDYR
jgi:predicted dithiol-disulfide oxidoreductase (DUF899 family)